MFSDLKTREAVAGGINIIQLAVLRAECGGRILTMDDGSLVPGVSNHDDPGWEDGQAARAARVGEAHICDRRATRGDGCHPPSVLEVFLGACTGWNTCPSNK